MSKPKHSTGRLLATRTKDGPTWVLLSGSKVVARGIATDRMEENFRRIEDCWNACGGIEDPALEIQRLKDVAGSVEAQAEGVARDHRTIKELRAQRDELLEALKSARMALADEGRRYADIEAAIARVEGRKS